MSNPEYKTVAEKEQGLLDKDEINRLKKLLRQCQITDKEKYEKIKYLESIITYLENKLEGY